MTDDQIFALITCLGPFVMFWCAGIGLYLDSKGRCNTGANVSAFGIIFGLVALMIAAGLSFIRCFA